MSKLDSNNKKRKKNKKYLNENVANKKDGKP